MTARYGHHCRRVRRKRGFTVFMTFVVAAWVALVMLTTPAASAPRTRTPRVLHELSSAYAYASHCGGVVQVEPLYDGRAHEDGSIGRHDVVVVGCDQ